jgi:hypothetical protein
MASPQVSLMDGSLRAWYFAPNGSWIWDRGLGIHGGFVADGQWHPIALVVDENGGRIYVDGLQTGALPWTGAPGAPTATAPLQFGRYDVGPTGLAGDLAEVVLWNAALSPEELQRLSNGTLELEGDFRIIGLWNFDEPAGTVAFDETGNGHEATLHNGVERIQGPQP